jgi:hypothetical protein
MKKDAKQLKREHKAELRQANGGPEVQRSKGKKELAHDLRSLQKHLIVFNNSF